MEYYYRGLRLKVWNRLNDLKGHIAIKLPASSDQYERWACIYADVPKSPFFIWADKWKYKYLEFEVEKKRLEETLADGEVPVNDDIIVKEEIPFEYEDDLFYFLEIRNLDLAKFDAPWHHNYPI
jgi:hypothetical protein